MVSNPPQKCCFEGYVWKGNTEGELSKLADIDVYITGDKSSKKLLLFTPDVWGVTATNLQICADNFARAGYLVVAVDVFDNDLVPKDRTGFDFEAWLSRHPPEGTWPIVDKVLSAAKEKFKPEFVAAIGYCYGANPTTHLLGEGTIDVGAWSHPSFVTEELVRNIKKPLVVAAAENDTLFTPELRFKTLEILREIKADYYFQVYSGTAHGFAARSDPDDEVTGRAMKKALAEQVWYFDEIYKSTLKKQNK